jgi:diguanylate cyclase (GGDEF)-like protein/PAS domain S-box-containing protein
MQRHRRTQRAILPAVFIAALVIAAALVAVAGSGYTQDGVLFGGGMSDFTGGWKTEDGSTADIPGTVSGSSPGTISITNTLPGKMDSNAVLLLRSTYASVTVSVNGTSLFTWDQQGQAPLIHSFGLRCYLISIPAGAAGGRIELQLRPDQDGSVRVGDIQLGNAVSAAATLIYDNLDTVVLFFVLAVMCIIFIVIAVMFRKHPAGYGALDLIYLTFFVALAAVWILSDSELMLLLTTNAAATLYTSVLSLMLLPFPLLIFVQRFVRRFAQVLHGLAILVLVNFFTCTVLALFGVELLKTLFTTHILQLLACLATTAVSFLEYNRHNRRELLSIPLGLGLFCLFAAVNVVSFAVTRDPSTSIFFRIGLTAFILCVGIVVIRRTISEMFNSKSFTNLTRSIPSGICRIESFETNRILFANDFYFKMFGYTPAEAKNAGFNTADFTVLPEDLAGMKEKIDNHFKYNFYRVETEARHLKKNGELIWVLSRYTLEPFGRGAISAVMIDITDRKNMEEKLRISEEEYRIATLHSNKLILRYDIKTRTCYCQEDTKLISGLKAVLENVPDSFLESGIIAQDSVTTFRSFFDMIYGGEREGSAVVSMFNRSSGEYGWYHFDFTAIYNDDDKPAQAIITFYDVTHQRQKELAFQRWQQSYNSIPKSATNYYEYNLTSDVFEHEEGGMIPPFPESLPRGLSDIATYIASKYVLSEDAALWQDFMSRDRLLERYANGQYTDKLEFRRLSGGEAYWTALGVQLIPDPYSTNVKGYFLLEDIDAHKKAEIVLQERSTRDSLTGLLNRASFIEQFNEILRKSDMETQHALIMLDIDNFKTINDTFGHAAGDALLVNVASRLKYALRSDDLCGRIGGDEFVICLKNMHRGKPLETRVNDLCSLVCNEQMHSLAVSASFGIASFPGDGVTFEELYRKSDIALYKVKSQGRGGFMLYDPQLSFDDLSVAGTH